MDAPANTYDSKEDALADGGGVSEDANRVKMWLTAIDAASREEKDWREEAEKSIKIYRGEEAQDSQTFFNILHSNIETILPAIYNSTPTPDIRRRFNDPGMDAKNVADVLERSISYSLDAYDFDGVMRSTLFDSYTTGRGVARVRYVPYFQGPEEAKEGEGTAPEAEPEHGDGMEDAEPGETVVYEEVITEYVPWQLFRRGPGRTWEDVSWIAFEHFLSREQLTDLNSDLAERVSMDAVVGGHSDEQGVDAYQGREQPPQSEIFSRARVWEIWDKDAKEVLFIAPSYKDAPLKVAEDPLQLQGFFPIPRPVQPLYTPGTLVPMCPYRAYKKLAEELNDITMRIRRLVRQLRVRGIYAGPTQSVEGIVNADDGELVPAPGLEVFIDGQGLDKAIAWWPMDPTVKALAQLYQQREQVKATIYEVTGLSDILRGNTQASETATAQQIKSQWGSLRIQRMQADVARFARDLFRMKAEIISQKFSTQQLQLMTGVPMTPQIEQILRSDMLRAFKIDIESDSTIRADLTRNKQEVSEFIQGTAAYVSAIGPALMEGVIPKELAVEIYASFARLQRLGKSAEDAIERAAEAARQEAQHPQEPKPDPKMIEAQQKAQLAQAQMQQQAQLEAQKLQLEQQKAQAEFGLKQQQAQTDAALRQQELEASIQMQREKHQSDLALSREKFANEARMGRNRMILDYKVKKQTAKGAPVEDDVANADFEDPMAEAMKPVADAVTQLGQLLAQQNAEAAQRQDQMMQAMQQIMMMVAAPKKVVRQNGQVVGVAPDMGMMQ